MSKPPLKQIFFFEGIDPAPAEGRRSDDGAMVIAAAQPRTPPGAERGDRAPAPSHPQDWFFDLVYGRRITAKTKASARQWSGMIHDHHRRFQLEKIGMDPNQGGVFIAREMILNTQLINNVETSVIPIADQVEGPKRVVHAHFILHMMKRGDPAIESLWPGLAGDDLLNSAMYSEFKDGLEQGVIAAPPLFSEMMAEHRDALRAWPEERRYALENLTAFISQAQGVIVAKKDDGSFAFTKRGAYQFSSVGKKDFVSAAINAYTVFLAWLKAGEWETAVNPQDAVQFSGWQG